MLRLRSAVTKVLPLGEDQPDELGKRILNRIRLQMGPEVEPQPEVGLVLDAEKLQIRGERDIWWFANQVQEDNHRDSLLGFMLDYIQLSLYRCRDKAFLDLNNN